MATTDILEIIRRDIAAFADPASKVELNEREASWQQRRRKMHATFIRSDGSSYPDIQINEQRYKYAEFFASEHMADLRSLAENIYSSMVEPTIYVSGRAQCAENGSEEIADSLITRLCRSELPYLRTQVVFLRGDAGAGKTFLLRNMARTQADVYLKAKECFLFLYVDAQARSLSRLDEAIATVVNDLRANFTYHAVPVLTRLGLLIPIIDGFDELLGVGGYKEALSSLTNFLARLEAEGALIASARASFYAVSDIERATTMSSSLQFRNFSYELVPVELKSWNDFELGEFVAQRDGLAILGTESKEDAIKILFEKIGPAGIPLVRTPFFADATLALLENKEGVPEGNRILHAIINLFVNREVGKLRDKHDAELLTREQHMKLLEYIAEEMWWQGSRELSEDTIRTLAELACGEFNLGTESAQALLSRVPTHALLAVQGDRSKFSFRHEYYYGYFLGKCLANTISNASPIEGFMSRSLLSNVIAKETVDAFDANWPVIATAIERLGGIRLTPMSRDVIRCNIGMIYAAVIAKYGKQMPGGVTFSEGFIEGADFCGTHLCDVVFRRCQLSRIDLRDANWERIVLIDTTLNLPIVNTKTTRLVIQNVLVPGQVQSIVTMGSLGEERRYDPSEVKFILSNLGTTIAVEKCTGSPATEIPARVKERTELFRRFLRMSGRMYCFSEDDLNKRGISKNPEWRHIISLIEKHGLLTKISIHKSGPTSTMLRLTIPQQELEKAESLSGGHHNAIAFWKDLKSTQ
ncbi:MAG: NACHT domain-containing protein [Elusimicrobiota bacterium]|jgi:hypothetical protein